MLTKKERKKRQTASLGRHAIVFVICAVLIMFSKADIAGSNGLRNIFADFFAPIADAVVIPFRAVAALMEGVESIALMREENQRLTTEVAQLKQWRNQAEILQAENRELRALTQTAIPPGLTQRTARVIAINADSFAHVVMVNVGRRAGVEKGSAVVTKDGLVGMVIETGLFYAHVLLITDLNAMIPVMLTTDSWPGVAAGVNGDYLELRFLPSQASPRVGELVQTSGHGGVLPANLPVGRISAINNTGNNAGGETKQIRISPTVDLRRLTYVTVLVWEEGNGRTVNDLNGFDGFGDFDDLTNQAYSPLPPADEEFSLEGINALGQRQPTDNRSNTP